MTTQLITLRGNRKYIRLPFIWSWKSNSAENRESEASNCKISGALHGIAEVSVKIAYGYLPFANIDDLSPERVNRDLSQKSEEHDDPKIEQVFPETGQPRAVTELNDILREFKDLSPKMEGLISPQSVDVFVFEELKEEEQETKSDSPPSFVRQIFLKEYGEKLTDAGKNLSDEDMNLLYQDIFKPVDFNSMHATRAK